MRPSEPSETGAAGRGAVVVIGGLFAVLAAAYPFLPFVGDSSPDLWIVLGALVGIPGLTVLVGGLWLPRTGLRPEFYETVATWCLRGIAIGLVVLVPIVLASDDSNVVGNVLLLGGLGSFAGFGAGVFDARAKSRQLELQETIERLETSNERLEQFTHAASHDLQEPLRMVSSYLMLLESRYGDDLDEDAREYIDYAVDGADRMRSMVDGILAYSNVETREATFEPVDLDGVLDEVRDDLQARIERSEAAIESEPLPRVEGNRGQLEQVFRHLLDNAIEYSGDAPPRVRISAERTDDTWSIAVRDGGVGIDPVYTDRIFDVFQRLHTYDEHPGAGIGLAICERIVERHGGDIWVDSTPGEGSTFTFTLPNAADSPDE